MTFETPDPIVSGRSYRVTDVAGHSPRELEEFVGDAHFVVDDHGITHLVTGVGMRVDDEVRFYEKDPHRDLKDVRVWLVSQGPDGSFAARHHAAI